MRIKAWVHIKGLYPPLQYRRLMVAYVLHGTPGGERAIRIDGNIRPWRCSLMPFFGRLSHLWGMLGLALARSGVVLALIGKLTSKPLGRRGTRQAAVALGAARTILTRN